MENSGEQIKIFDSNIKELDFKIMKKFITVLFIVLCLLLILSILFNIYRVDSVTLVLLVKTLR